LRGRRRALLAAAFALAACGPRRDASSSPASSASASASSAPSTIGNRSAAPMPVAAGDPDALPADVQALIDRWESCQHWSGEEPYDRERARDIAAAIDDTCPGNDATRAALERRYASDPHILARLRALSD
jgi:hypothetical protein